MLGFFPKSVRDYIRAIHGNEQLSPEQVIEQVVTYLADPPSTEIPLNDLLGAYLIHLGYRITSHEELAPKRWEQIRVAFGSLLDEIGTKSEIARSGLRTLYDCAYRPSGPSLTRAFTVAINTIDTMPPNEQSPLINDAIRHFVNDRIKIVANRIRAPFDIDPSTHHFFAKILDNLFSKLSNSILNHPTRYELFVPENETAESFVQMINAADLLYIRRPEEFPNDKIMLCNPNAVPESISKLAGLFCALSKTENIRGKNYFLTPDGTLQPILTSSSPTVPRPLAA